MPALGSSIVAVFFVDIVTAIIGIGLLSLLADQQPLTQVAVQQGRPRLAPQRSPHVIHARRDHHLWRARTRDVALILLAVMRPGWRASVGG